MSEDPATYSASALESALEQFARDNGVLNNKGPLAVMLAVNHQLKALARPYQSVSLVTGKKGQVKGLGKSATQAVLARYSITRVLAEEGGRTSRGSMNLMQAYLDFVNKWETSTAPVDLEACERFWVAKVQEYFAGKPFVLRLDPAWSMRKAVRHLMAQAIARQRESTGSMFLGTLMQHMVGAKLDVIMGVGKIRHHSANASDQRPGRHGDFDVEDVAIHVSTAPGEALIRKCSENLGKGKRPIIITTVRGAQTADGLLDNASLADRVDLIEFEQFIATNVFEHGRFKVDGQQKTFQAILNCYNAIVEKNETDPGLRIELTSGK